MEERFSKTRGTERAIWAVTQYEYDAAGNLLRRMDESLEEMLCRREYRYDKKDRLTHFVDEEGAMTRLFYDKNDRVRKVVRPEQYEEQKDDGIVLSYTYNCHDQVLAVTDVDGMPLNSYTYDRAGNISPGRRFCLYGVFL